MSPSPQKKNFFLRVAAVIFVLIVLFFISLPFLIRSSAVEPLIRNTIQAQTGFEPSYSRFSLTFLPLPTLRLTNLELRDTRSSYQIFFKAAETSVRISVLSFLFGKLELVYVQVKDGALRFQIPKKKSTPQKSDVSYELDHLSLELWNVMPRQPVRFKLKADVFGGSGNLNASGVLQADFESLDPEHIFLEMKTSIESVMISDLLKPFPSLPLTVQDGRLSFVGEIKKAEDASLAGISGFLRIKDLAYRAGQESTLSQKGDYEAKFQLAFDMREGSLVIQEGLLTAPFGGPFQINGKGNVFQPRIEEFYLQTKSLRMEALPQYLLSFREMMPVNLSFSGETRLDCFLKGNPGLLAANLRIDLSDTTLGYGTYFSKPSGIPLTLKGEAQLAAGRGLRGDFTLDFEQATLKGSVVGLDLASGQGEVTILTNKFLIDGWNRFIPMFESVQLSGAVKVFMSSKGNLKRLDEAQFMNNITFDQVSARVSNGAAISYLSGLVDFGPFDFEAKDIRFEIGKSRFKAEAKMFSKPDAKWLIYVNSDALYANDFLNEVKKFSEAFKERVTFDFVPLQKWLSSYFPAGTSFENASLEIARDEHQLIIPDFHFNLYGGTFKFQAMHPFSKKKLSNRFAFELKEINLAKWQMEKDTGAPFMDGRLYLIGDFGSSNAPGADVFKTADGKGSFHVTNGEFHKIDLLATLSKITKFSGLGSLGDGSTRFHDVSGDFRVKDGMIGVQNFIFVSDDFQIEGEGEVGLDQSLNFKLSVYLAPPLSRKIIPGLEETERLGPIPLLLVGTVQKPSVRPDPMLIESFIEHLLQEQFSKVTGKLMAPLEKRSKTESVSDAAKTGSKGMSGGDLGVEAALVQGGFKMLEQFLVKKSNSGTAAATSDG